MSAASAHQRVAKLEARSFSLDDLVLEVRRGKVRVPKFQRRFRWTASDVERLFESIYRGYPIGTLLFWKRPAPEGTISLGGVSWAVDKIDEAYWVVDGQQRLTSLALSVLEDIGVSDRRFNVYFDPTDETFSTVPPGATPSDSLLPVRKAFDLSLVLEWTATVGAEGVQRDRAFGLTKRLRDFQVPAYIVETDSEDAAREIFDRMNTFGKRMKRSEVFDALHGSMGDIQPHRLEWVGEPSRETDFGEIDNQQLLYSVLATRGTNVLRDFHSEFDSKSDIERRQAFENARLALGRTIHFLRTDGKVHHARLIPYQHLLVALVRFFHLYPEPSDRNLVLLRRWFWRGAVVGPHLKGGTTGTLRQMVSAVVETGESEAVALLLEKVLPQTGEPNFSPTSQVRLSVAESRITLAAMNALNPISPISRESVAAEDLWGTEREPLPVLFPPSQLGHTDTQIANRLLIGPQEMDEISAIDALLHAATFGWDNVLSSHLIDRQFIKHATAGRATVALEHRAKSINDHVTKFVTSLAEWDLPDRPSIEELLRDVP